MAICDSCKERKDLKRQNELLSYEVQYLKDTIDSAAELLYGFDFQELADLLSSVPVHIEEIEKKDRKS